MSDKSKIEWCDATWNPVMGCTPVSEACDNCYARAMIRRFGGSNKGFPASPDDVTLYHERLNIPQGWRKPRRVFVCSMSDLFHEDVPDDFICKAYETMMHASQHTFMVLTKRPERMKAWHEQWFSWGIGEHREFLYPFSNVWLGVTVENQARADERIPLLLSVPAAVHFVSVEPMLGPVDLMFDGRPGRGRPDYLDGLDWVICGGETGQGSRAINQRWAYSLSVQCHVSGVPLFFKGWGRTLPPLRLIGCERQEFPVCTQAGQIEMPMEAQS